MPVPVPEGAVAARHHEDAHVGAQRCLQQVVRPHDVSLHGGVEGNAAFLVPGALLRMVGRPRLGGQVLYRVKAARNAVERFSTGMVSRCSGAGTPGAAGMRQRRNPRRASSAKRRSSLGTARISPVNPTSPTHAMSAGTGES